MRFSKKLSKILEEQTLLSEIEAEKIGAVALTDKRSENKLVVKVLVIHSRFWYKFIVLLVSFINKAILHPVLVFSLDSFYQPSFPH